MSIYQNFYCKHIDYGITNNYSFRCADDSTVGFINWNDSTYGWIYKTFKFTNYPEVHIHCDALICLTNDVDPECDRSCLKTTTTTSTTSSSTVASGTGGTTASGSSGRRRKRSAPLQRIHLSSPTIIVYDPHYDGSIITRGEESKYCFYCYGCGLSNLKILFSGSPSPLDEALAKVMFPYDICCEWYETPMLSNTQPTKSEKDWISMTCTSLHSQIPDICIVPRPFLSFHVGVTFHSTSLM